MRLRILKKKVDKAFEQANYNIGDLFLNFKWLEMDDNRQVYACYGLFIEWWG
jgi:hypothetical protein